MFQEYPTIFASKIFTSQLEEVLQFYLFTLSNLGAQIRDVQTRYTVVDFGLNEQLRLDWYDLLNADKSSSSIEACPVNLVYTCDFS